MSRLEPRALPSSPASLPPAAAAPTESVERPESGLARGRWEAPPWAFAIAGALTLLGSLVWLALALRARRSDS